MANRKRIGTRTVGKRPEKLEINFLEWGQIDVDALSDVKRKKFLDRKLAIEMYVSGATEATIREQTGQSISNIYRLITERCLKRAEDGTLQGWRGALPYRRVGNYTRHLKPEISESGSGASGALNWLFSSPDGPELEKKFRDQIVGKTRLLETTKRSKQTHFKWFIKELCRLGHDKRGDWPFNAERLGYITICKFVDKVLAENPKRQTEILGGLTASRKARAGDGVDRPRLRVFDRVECDAHKLDTRMVVLIPSPHGGFESRKIHRLWVIVLMEVESRAVIGYYLSLGRECSAEDVLRAIKKALSRWTPTDLHFSSNAYVKGAALPSYRSERYLGACWDEFSVDGALANICGRVERPMQDIVGARILKPQDPRSYSSRRSLDDRPFIETFFRQLTSGGVHKLSTSTGNRPSAKNGYDPDISASKSAFQLEYAEELLDALIANYNASPHSGIGSRTPLEQLDFLTLRRSAPLRLADPDEVKRMVGIRKLCTLLGGVAKGRRPHFNFFNARYSAEWLCLRTDLIGKTLWLKLEDEDDARFASVSTMDGVYLGHIRAAPAWHATPHTLYQRASIRQMEKKGILHLSASCDAIEELIIFSEQQVDKKLPVHPAYLMARRIKVQHAEWLIGQSMVARANEELLKLKPEPIKKLQASKPVESGEQLSCLPTPRTGKQW